MAMLATNGGSSMVAKELGLGLMSNPLANSAANTSSKQQPQPVNFEVRYCHLQANQLQSEHYLIDAEPGAKTSALLDIPPSLGGTMDSISELLRIHDDWPFELLHLHNLQIFGLSALLLKQLRNVPYIVTFHGSDILNPHLFDQNLEVATQVLRHAGAITCVSNYLADKLRQKVPDLTIIHVISNFVRASWRDVEFVCKVQPQRFLHVSSMRAVKRPGVLLNAFSQLQKHLPNAHLAIVTTTEGARRTKKMLNDGVHSGHGLQIIDGDLNPQALTDEYAQAHAMVLTSSFEGFGLVVLEALQHNLPVITPAVGALPEILGKDWPYLVIEQEGERAGVQDDEQLSTDIAQAMNKAVQAPNECLKSLIKQIVNRYRGPQQIAQYAALYQRILKNQCQDY